jgi:hypothetical protein
MQALGLVLMIVGIPSHAAFVEDRTGLRVEPVVSPDGAGIVGRF